MQNVQEITRQAIPPPQYLSGTQDILRVIEGLPPNTELILNGQEWEDYENLIEAVGEASHLRIAFDGETIQIMTLSTTHEKIGRLLEKLILVFSLRRGIDIEAFGSSTVKLSKEEKGLQPDACFYIQNVDVIGGRSVIDFSVDPMPDIAVEVDLFNTSLSKFHIYAALGFPEIWRYFHDHVEFHRLEDGKYVPIERSDALPMLTAKVLGEFLNRAHSEKQSVIVRDFEAWIISNGS